MTAYVGELLITSPDGAVDDDVLQALPQQAPEQPAPVALTSDEQQLERELQTPWHDVAPEAMDLAAVNVDVFQQYPLVQPMPEAEQRYGREQSAWKDPTLIMPDFYAGGHAANGHKEVDGKDLIDATPKEDIEIIAKKFYELKEYYDNLSAEYKEAHPEAVLDWHQFYADNFDPPVRANIQHDMDPNASLEQKLDDTLEAIIREHPENAGSLLATKGLNFYPGARFSEAYYWDNGPTLDWLLVKADEDPKYLHYADQMMKSLAGLVEDYGFIPNGTRAYYLDRSQPAAFGGMVKTLAEYKAGLEHPEEGFDDQVYKEVMAEYLQPMVKEHNYWTNGLQSVDTDARRQEVAAHNGDAPIVANCSVVSMPDGSILNRYWSYSNRPRPESFREDVELAIKAGIKNPFEPNEFYREINAGAASGADFMADRFADGKDMTTIQSTNLVTTELNSLLYDLEKNIAAGYESIGNDAAAGYFHNFADQRANAMNKYLWDDDQKWYMDYQISDPNDPDGNPARLPRPNLFGAYPLASGIVDQERAGMMAETIDAKFLREGGLIMNLNYDSTQQWDGMNVWAPPQLRAVKGLFLTGHTELAMEANHRYLDRAIDIHILTGMVIEKMFGGKEIKAGGGGEYAAVEWLTMADAAARMAMEIAAENPRAFQIMLGYFAASRMLDRSAPVIRMPGRDRARAV